MNRRRWILLGLTIAGGILFLEREQPLIAAAFAGGFLGMCADLWRDARTSAGKEITSTIAILCAASAITALALGWTILAVIGSAR